jgi:spore coat protein CotH
VSSVKPVPASVSLYEQSAVRTFFLEFENADWEQELEVFRNTDVDVPAVVTVDGKRYANVGVHFRGT